MMSASERQLMVLKELKKSMNLSDKNYEIAKKHLKTLYLDY